MLPGDDDAWTNAVDDRVMIDIAASCEHEADNATEADRSIDTVMIVGWGGEEYDLELEFVDDGTSTSKAMARATRTLRRSTEGEED